MCTCADKHYNLVTCIWIRSSLCLWMPWPRYLPYIPRLQCWCKQWRHRWFGNSSRTLWRHCNDFDDTEIVPLACVDSLPSNCTNYFHQQWLRHWHDAYTPSHCLNQWWFEIIDIHHLCKHEFHDNHPIALPFRAGGWREVPGLSTCLVPDDQPHTAAILALLVEVPDLGSELHPSYIFVILLYYMMLPSNGNIFLCWWPFVRGPPVTGWFPSQWLVTQSFDLHCSSGCSGPTRAKPSTDTQLLTAIVLSRLSVSANTLINIVVPLKIIVVSISYLWN